MTVLVAVETGGTKIICRVVDGERTLAQFRLPTGEPEGTLAALIAQVREATGDRAVAGVGVASFGPVDVVPGSDTYGSILETTKPGWRGFDLVGALARGLGAPVEIDTDVNAAALAEQALGAGRGLHTVAYVTVGTGIGGGLAMEGRTLKGGLHPEIGHLRVAHAPGDEQASVCGFHTDCVEGLASGPAVQARLKGRALAEAPEVEGFVVDYLGQLCAQLLLAWSPQRIVLGGGVLSDGGLIPRIEDRMRRDLNGYGAVRVAGQAGYLAPAILADAGLEGALLMARRVAA